jgi:putative methionine-R-sulfoxide reductase with GAF domain
METLRPSPRELPPPPPTRRRSVRLKVHTPAYVSLNGDASGQVLDLSEIVDISEDGMAIQTSSPLQVRRSVNLCLDLTATRTCIHTSGQVIWSDRSGRAGIRFPQMPAEALRQLKEWLFLNSMIACVNHRADQLSRLPAAAAPAQPPAANPLVNWMRHELEPAAPADYTSILAALAAVKREAEALGSDLDRALRLIADRAQTFTRATGAAIALTAGAEMICRASVGPDAPGLGARLTVGSGFSGECVRTGRLLRCEDSESDPLVDRQSCRVLGIRSMIAVPIRWNEAVIGLLEVFSPEPHAFSPNDDLVLKRLADIVSAAVHRAGASEPETNKQEAPERLSPRAAPLRRAETSAVKPQPVSPRAPAVVVDDEFPVETTADLPLPHFSRARKLLLLAAAATVLVALSWVISPSDFKGSGFPHPSAQPPKPASAPPESRPPASTPPATNVSTVSGPVGMRKLAEQGDAAAQFAVGARYATGEDVPQDYTEAVRWFSMAAEQGHAVSQATLGAYYWAGRGVPQDLVKAYFWSVLAQTGGDEASKYRVAHLASRMTHAQVVEAQQSANDWIKEHQTLSQNRPATP